MANCIVCEKRIGFTNNGSNGRCTECTIRQGTNNQLIDKLSLRHDVELLAKDAEFHAKEAKIEAVMLTTENSTSLHITKRIEIVTAEVAYNMNIFKDLFAGVRDIVGGRSDAVQKTMRDARKTALHELKREAHSVGANAVVGVDLDYVELSSGSNMVMLVASGSAVIIEE